MLRIFCLMVCSVVFMVGSLTAYKLSVDKAVLVGVTTCLHCYLWFWAEGCFNEQG